MIKTWVVHPLDPPLTVERERERASRTSVQLILIYYNSFDVKFDCRGFFSFIEFLCYIISFIGKISEDIHLLEL